jgi:hypothetical protein
VSNATGRENQGYVAEKSACEETGRLETVNGSRSVMKQDSINKLTKPRTSKCRSCRFSHNDAFQSTF